VVKVHCGDTHQPTFKEAQSADIPLDYCSSCKASNSVNNPKLELYFLGSWRNFQVISQKNE